MKYFFQDEIEELRGVEKKYKAVTVNYDHCSLLIFERIRVGEIASVIDLSKWAGTGEEPVHTLLDGLSVKNTWETVVDEFGDEMTVSDLRDIVRKSYAKVRNGRSDMGKDFTEIIGPISEIDARWRKEKAAKKEEVEP